MVACCTPLALQEGPKAVISDWLSQVVQADACDAPYPPT